MQYNGKDALLQTSLFAKTTASAYNRIGIFNESMNKELCSFAEPILESPVFQRLSRIAFLGILSPRFAKEIKSPLFSRKKVIQTHEGSRLDHSLGVASIALSMAKNLGFSREIQRYSVVWGLTHDIASWPLSHTGESAFAGLTKISMRRLRRRIILGDSLLPSEFSLRRHLLKIRIDPNKLLGLFSSSSYKISHDLTEIKMLFGSPVSPDTIEGIWRSGRIFSVSIPGPHVLLKSINKDLFDIVVCKEHSKRIFDFWRGKANIYKKYINRPDVIAWESAWSKSIKQVFPGIGLIDSLNLPENEIVNSVKEAGVLPVSAIFRYKFPMEYVVYPTRKRSFSKSLSLKHIHRTFKCRKLKLEKSVCNTT